MKAALALPLRIKIRRKIHKKEQGILVFAKKGKDAIFKFLNVKENLFGGEPKDILLPIGFELLKAAQEEKSLPVSDCFCEFYTQVKNSLFKQPEETRSYDKNKRDAVDKIDIIIKDNVCDENYLKDLKNAVEVEAVSGAELKLINGLKSEEYKYLPNEISNSYIQRALANINEQNKAPEYLILAQEIMEK